MAYQDGTRRISETSNPPRAQNSPNSKTPKAQTSPTFQQLLQGESSTWSPNSSPKLKKNQDREDDVVHQPKKSVLTKVKEKARKLRNSLSGKKRHDENELQGSNTTPSWGVTLDDEEDEKDAEYLGAPMYESEMAPDNYKQAAKQHPREVHMVPTEKNVVASSAEQRKNDLLTLDKTIVTDAQPEKLTPPHTAVSDTAVSKRHTQNIDSKISGLTVSTPEGKTSTGVHDNNSGINKLDGSSDQGGEKTKTSPQTWDKGVSVKEYLMHKFEPGEDERALSQVITETISPRRGPGDMGVVDKMREAVNSLLRPEEPSQAMTKTTYLSTNVPTTSNANRASPVLISTTKTSTSYSNPVSNANATRIPVTTNVHEVVEEENHGRILQAN